MLPCPSTCFTRHMAASPNSTTYKKAFRCNAHSELSRHATKRWLNVGCKKLFHPSQCICCINDGTAYRPKTQLKRTEKRRCCTRLHIRVMSTMLKFVYSPTLYTRFRVPFTFFFTSNFSFFSSQRQCCDPLLS